LAERPPEGAELYQKKDWDGSIAAFQKVLDSKDAPDNFKASAAYNIGCDHALAGRNDKAVEYVVKAIDLGFFEWDHLRVDEDLKSVVNDPKIADAMKRNQAKKDAADAEQKKLEAEQKKMMEERRKSMDVELMKELPAALEKLKDKNGPGFNFTFDLKTLDGKPLTSKGLAGKVAVVDIWAPWCPPCKLEIANFVSVVDRHKNDRSRWSVSTTRISSKTWTPMRPRRGSRPSPRRMGSTTRSALIDTKTIKQVPGFQGYPTTIFPRSHGEGPHARGGLQARGVHRRHREGAARRERSLTEHERTGGSPRRRASLVTPAEASSDAPACSGRESPPARRPAARSPARSTTSAPSTPRGPSIQTRAPGRARAR
jgi:thiol-disulfide isomerase/thioredoxin